MSHDAWNMNSIYENSRREVGHWLGFQITQTMGGGGLKSTLQTLTSNNWPIFSNMDCYLLLSEASNCQCWSMQSALPGRKLRISYPLLGSIYRSRKKILLGPSAKPTKSRPEDLMHILFWKIYYAYDQLRIIKFMVILNRHNKSSIDRESRQTQLWKKKAQWVKDHHLGRWLCCNIFVG